MPAAGKCLPSSLSISKNMHVHFARLHRPVARLVCGGVSNWSNLGTFSESESDMYSATINEDYYAEAGVVSKVVSASCN